MNQLLFCIFLGLSLINDNGYMYRTNLSFNEWSASLVSIYLRLMFPYDGDKNADVSIDQEQKGPALNNGLARG